jgi:uncharacterized protein (TIGR01777 family)
MKLIISGASGLVGTALTSAFRAEGHTVLHLVRSNGILSPDVIRWDPTSAQVDVSAMEGTDVVVHLSGASISQGRWTPARRAVLRSSRVDSTRVLVDSLAQLRQKPRVFLCASAVGYYGNRGDEILTESAEPGTDFLSLLARDWEAEASRAALCGIRTLILRFGVILAGNGGALPQMIRPFRFGLGGPLGNGHQWLSWVALEDVIGIIRFVVASEQINGPVNVVAPKPVQNAEFARIVAHTVHRPAIFRAPAFALRLALGEMADALLLASQRARPEKILAAGYSFYFEDLETTLRAILAKE